MVRRFLSDEEIVRLAQEGYLLTEAEIVRLGHLIDGAERRGAVKALRNLGEKHLSAEAWHRADAIEAGADW